MKPLDQQESRTFEQISDEIETLLVTASVFGKNPTYEEPENKFDELLEELKLILDISDYVNYLIEIFIEPEYESSLMYSLGIYIQHAMQSKDLRTFHQIENALYFKGFENKVVNKLIAVLEDPKRSKDLKEEALHILLGNAPDSAKVFYFLRKNLIDSQQTQNEG